MGIVEQKIKNLKYLIDNMTKSQIKLLEENEVCCNHNDKGHISLTRIFDYLDYYMK